MWQLSEKTRVPNIGTIGQPQNINGARNCQKVTLSGLLGVEGKDYYQVISSGFYPPPC